MVEALAATSLTGPKNHANTSVGLKARVAGDPTLLGKEDEMDHCDAPEARLEDGDTGKPTRIIGRGRGRGCSSRSSQVR